MTQKELDKIMNKIITWGNQFIKTQHFKALTEEQKSASEFVVLSFTKHMYAIHRLSPEEWSEPALEQVCVTALPMMIAADDLYFTSMAPVLSAFFEFLAERKLVKSASSLAQKVRKLDQQIVQNAADPEHWNAAKTVFMAGIKAGVDMMNERERDRFVESAREGPLGCALAQKSLKEKESLNTRKKKGKREEKGGFMSIDSYCELVKIGE